MANKVKTYCEQPNRRNLHVWNSHGPQAAHGYPRQRSAANIGLPYIDLQYAAGSAFLEAGLVIDSRKLHRFIYFHFTLLF